MRFLFLGERALTIEVGEEISKDINDKVIALNDFIIKSRIKGVTEVVPTYTAVTVFYNPLFFDLNSFIDLIKENEESFSCSGDLSRKVIEIPVVYGGEYGEDLERVCSHSNLTKEEVIKIHCSNNYLVYMIGFTPGFPYLGGMDSKISTPRLEVPRKKIWKGSVGIAGEQTGIYPLESPGGWNIIGRTPIDLFDLESDEPTLLKAGDYVKFVPIDEETYLSLSKKDGES